MRTYDAYYHYLIHFSLGTGLALIVKLVADWLNIAAVPQLTLSICIAIVLIFGWHNAVTIYRQLFTPRLLERVALVVAGIWAFEIMEFW